MTTLVIKLTPAQAKRLAAVCNAQKLTHHEFARLALLLAIKAAQ